MKLLDLHRHWDCSHSVNALTQVAQEYNIDFFQGKDIKSLVVQQKEGDWDSYYDCLINTRKAYVSLDAIEDLSYYTFRDAANETDGFELRLTLISITDALLKNQGRDVDTGEFICTAESILACIISGKEKAFREDTRKVWSGLRFAFTRREQFLHLLEPIAVMIINNYSEFTGLDLLGKEDKYTFLPEHQNVIERTREYLPDLCVHTEMRGLTGVYDALLLNPTTIGHGLNAAEDAAVMNELVKKNILLEVTPRSYSYFYDYESKLIKSHLRTMNQHPLVTLQQHGVPFVLGTDIPGNFETTILQEYAFAEKVGVDMRQVEQDALKRYDCLTAITRNGLNQR
ncbi:MAG: hypothetical protein Q8R37_00360 [Nanoarchaeota archaeon]|nr:hypothetical protein [Nanoarchaeota archaeon]